MVNYPCVRQVPALTQSTGLPVGSGDQTGTKVIGHQMLETNMIRIHG